MIVQTDIFLITALTFKMIVLLMSSVRSNAFSILQRRSYITHKSEILRRSLATSGAMSDGHGSQLDSSVSLRSSLLKNFVTNIIEADLANGKNGGRVLTRFPPEPNGYLHLGHAKSINFNFAVAKAYGGQTNMRFDDTNPTKEDMEYVNAILDDVRWLVAGDTRADPPPWTGSPRHTSDYFPVIYNAAEYLITKGLAYVDELTPEEMKSYRGTLTQPGKDSPYRTRSVEENMRLFREMKAGSLPDGHCVLRAKIDMHSPNLNLRDPTIYRIKHAVHPITGDQWHIYPMYDFAHAISDAYEGITHSLCTMEFDNHRPLYDWIIDQLQPSGLLNPFGSQHTHAQPEWRPHQYEFSRLNVQYTVLSKRKLIQLVREGHVDGWDDPRMPTICGLRRRGFSPEALRLFCERVGISKAENNIDLGVLEDCAREVLDAAAPRLFAIQDPLKVTITNFPSTIQTPAAPATAGAAVATAVPAAEETCALSAELFSVERHPKRPELGSRELPFTQVLYIDRDDFFDTGVDGSLAPPKGFKRLVPGGQVRLKFAYVITCDEVVRDSQGEVVELKCSYNPDTRAGFTPEGMKKVRGIIQWISQDHAVPAELHLYDRLFMRPSPGKEQPDGDFLKDLNPDSLRVCRTALVEPSVLESQLGDTFQFERIGYFTLDVKSNGPEMLGWRRQLGKDGEKRLAFNRVVTLRDTWGAQQQQHVDSTSNNAESGVDICRNRDRKKGGGGGTSPVPPAIEDIRRVEFRVGVVLSAEQHPDADNLYVQQVDCGDASGPRTIISGLAGLVPLEELVGKRAVVVCNLKPTKMRGVLSHGMLLAASGTRPSVIPLPPAGGGGEEAASVVELVTPPVDAPVGELIHVEGFDAPQPDALLKSKTAQDAWKRVVAQLATNAQREATFGGVSGQRLLTRCGPCVVQTLANAPVR